MAVDGRHVISPVTLGRTVPSFFFDVGELAASCHFAVPSEDAAASERGETQKPNETHMKPSLAASVSKRCAGAAGKKPAWFGSRESVLLKNIGIHPLEYRG